MNIAVNTRLLIKDKLDGIGWFSYEILNRICKAHPEHQFYFLFDRKFSSDFIFSDNITPIVLFPPARHPFLWYIWFELSVKRVLKKINADLFFSPDGFVPLSSDIRSISVIHDINFKHRPKDLPFFSRKYYNYFFPKFARKVNKIITVSKYSKQDIATQYHIQNNKIEVVYNGCNEIYKPLDEKEKQKIRNKYTSGNEYFIFIGSMHPRKNIENLFKAFETYKNETKSNFKLVIVGQKFFLTKNIENAYKLSKFKEDIIFTGRISNKELHELLASSYALTFVSFFEGFGIPIIEAMNCDVPVICSEVTSMPEIAGDAALYIDPYSVESIKNAMISITEDESIRDDLINKGQKKRSLYNWDKAATEIWNIIEKELTR